MSTTQTVTQEELDEMADEFMNHWPSRHVIDSVSPTTGETVTFTGTDGTTCSISRTDTFDAAFDRVANWSRAMTKALPLYNESLKFGKQVSNDQSSFAAFESAALGEW